jgi:hypothetical protein
MKPNTLPDPDDAELNELLRSWQSTPSLPPRFHEAVWRRIEHGAVEEPPLRSHWAAIRELIVAWCFRPAPVAAYLAVVVAFGAVAGWLQARERNARVMNDLSEHYAHAVDPYHVTGVHLSHLP